ncbi:MAG TPA: glycosyltransferase family 4 protein [Lacunisphaera sp.]
MDFQLPPHATFRQFSRHENGWSDHYGAIQTAAAYAGIACQPRYAVRGVWQHGVFGPWQNQEPEAIVYSTPRARELPVWVARPEQAEVLRAAGFLRVRVAGMPICYTPDTGVVRVSGSLLVVPTHTLAGDKFTDRSAFERYADEIKAVAGHFREVVICVHPACQKNGLWVREFTERGFSIVYGAQTNDANALLRMRMLFEQFESVTTNGWGSHVAYALAFGAKVSIHGSRPQRSEADYLRDLCWAANPTALRTMLSGETQRREREYLQEYFQSPEQGVADVAAGRRLIGADHCLARDEMRQALAELTDLPVDLAAPVASTGAGKRRVLFVSHEASRTGAPMFLLHLLRWLKREACVEFEVLVIKPGPLEDEFRKLALVHSPADFAGRPDVLSRFDLVYANTVFCAELLERLGCDGTRVVTHLHELDSGFRWAGARAMAAGLRHTDRFIACATAVADRFSAIFGLKPDRMVLHHEMVNAPDLAAVVARRDEAALRRQFNLPADALVVAACGTLDQRKGADLFVQMAAHLVRTMPGRPMRLLWIGAQTRGMQMIFEEDVRKLGLTGIVTLVGELADPHPLLSLCDVFCLTSREDPFPLAMLEAAGLGKPVVCFDGAGGGREFCDLGGGNAVPYLDLAAMAAACRDLLVDVDGRRAAGDRAARLVGEKFSIETIAPAVWRTVETVLARPIAAHPPVTDVLDRWAIAQAPDPAYVSAHLARAALRRQARQLAAAGRSRDAVQLLVKAVNADFASKDLVIICESLVQIGEDLAAYDARQSAILLERASTIARQGRLELGDFRGRTAA